MGVDIDTLQIQIEATSSDAAQRVNDLADALERLKSATQGGGFSSIVKKIHGIGNTAAESTGVTANIQKRQQALQKASSMVSPKVDSHSTVELEGLTKKVELLHSAVQSVNKEFSDSDEELRALATEYKSLEAILDRFGQQAEKIFPSVFAKIYDAMDQNRERWDYLWNHRSAVMTTSFADIKAQNDEVARLVSQFNGDVSTEKQNAGSQTVEEVTQKVSTLQSILNGAKESTSAFGSALKNAFSGIEKDNRLSEFEVNIKKAKSEYQSLLKELSEKVSLEVGDYQQLTDARNKVEQLQDAYKRLKTEVGSGSIFSSASLNDLSKLNAGLKSVGTYMASKFVKPFTSAIATVTKWKNSLGRIAFYRTIRAAIAAVTSGFKEGIENLYQYSTLMGTSFAPTMNSLATSALYLKNSLGAMAAPLIEAVAPAVDYLIDKFVALLNVIGKLFAVLSGKGTYTQAVKASTEFAEAADSAAGSAKALKTYLLGFDELNIFSPDTGSGGSGGGALDDYSSMFEEVTIDGMDWAAQIKQAIENGDWYGAGTILAEKLNSVVDNWDSYAWGTALGQKVNNGLNAAYGFMTNFSFEGLGAKVADGLNGIFDTVDWDLLGHTFATKWNALFDLIYGFVTTFHWDTFGQAIADAVNGWFDEIDWGKTAQTISTGVKGALSSASTALKETDFVEIGRSIGEFIINIDWDSMLGGAAYVIADALTGVFQTAFGMAAEGLTGDGEGILGNALSVAAGAAVSLVTVAYLTSLLKTVGTKLSKLSATKRTLASAILVAIEFGVSEWSITDFLDTGDWKDILLDALSVSASSFLLYKTLGAKGLILGVTVGLAANIASLTGELASGNISATDWKALLTEAVTIAMGGIGGGFGLTKLGFFPGEGFVIGLAVTAALTFAAINFGGIAGGAWDSTSTESILTSVGSTLAAGIGGYVLAGAIFGSAAGPVGIAIGLGVGLVINVAAAIIGEKIAYENSEFYQQVQEWKAKAEESIEVTKQIQVNIETRYSEYSEIENEYAAYIGILDEIFRLDEIPEKSAGELALMSSYVDIINGLNLEGLYLHFDEATGKIIETKDSIYGVIDALMAQAKMEAAYDSIVQIYKDKNEVLLQTKELENELKDATALVTEKQEAYNKALTEYQNAGKQFTDGGARNVQALDNFKIAVKEAKQELSDTIDAQQDLQKSWDESQKKIEDLESQLKFFQDELIDLQGVTAKTSASVDNTFSGTGEKWGTDASNAVVNFADSITSNTPLVESAMKGMVEPVIDTPKDMLKMNPTSKVMDDYGLNTDAGYANGICNNKSLVVKATQEVMNAVIDTPKDMLEMNPASKVMADYGLNTDTGLANGISENSGLVTSAMSSAMGELDKTTAGELTDIDATALTKSGDIQTTLSNAWIAVRDMASAKLLEIQTTISKSWSDIKSSALTWGSDICSNLASGIRSKIGSVTSAASAVASKISSYLHFSEPDIGPLSDFHTYMPDMLELMAKGIKDNAYLAVNAVSGLADSVSGVFGDLVYSNDDMQFPTHERAFARSSGPYGGQYGDYGGGDGSEEFFSNIRQSNEEMMNVVLSGIQQIVNAINEHGGDIYVDGEKVGSKTTSIQNRQNRIYGKTLQNT